MATLVTRRELLGVPDHREEGRSGEGPGTGGPGDRRSQAQREPGRQRRSVKLEARRRRAAPARRGRPWRGPRASGPVPGRLGEGAGPGELGAPRRAAAPPRRSIRRRTRAQHENPAARARRGTMKTRERGGRITPGGSASEPHDRVGERQPAGEIRVLRLQHGQGEQRRSRRHASRRARPSRSATSSPHSIAGTRAMRESGRMAAEEWPVRAARGAAKPRPATSGRERRRR